MKPEIYYLSNKIPVIICNTDFQTCKILISLDFGGFDETVQEYGITHFIEHLLGQSVSGEKSFGHLKKKIETLGGDINLYTNYEKIGCFVNVLPEYLIDVVNIVAPQIITPVFDVKSVEHEKNVILEEYNRYVASNSWTIFKYQSLFKNTGLEHCILGTVENIQSFTAETLSKYYFSHLSSNKCNIVIIGSVYDLKNLLSKLENTFGKIPYISYERNFSAIQQTVKHNLKLDTENIKLALSFSAKIPYERKDQIIIGLLRKILQDRLIDSLRYKKGLVYFIRCSTMGIPGTKLYTIETETNIQNIKSVVKTIALVCKNILKIEPITQEELKFAKNVIKFNSAKIMDSIDKSCDLFAQYMIHYHSVYNADYEDEILNKIQLSDIQDMAQKFLNSPLSVVTQGPEYDCDIVKLWEEQFLS